MLDFLYSQKKKMRKNATQWLEMADRVYKFRRDQLTDGQKQQLLAAADTVKVQLREKADPSKLKPAIDALEDVLRQTGGRIYPTSSMVENVEFFLVAAIVILGLRAYFIQPFKIPTNSMWPSYYGMTAQVFAPGEEPGVIRQLVRLVTLGARNYTLLAPSEGEVMIPVFDNLQVAYTEQAGRSLWVFPATMREYYFKVGGKSEKLTVPADFQGDFEQVLNDAFKGSEPDLLSVLQKAAARTPTPEHSTLVVRSGARPVTREVYWLPIGKMVRRGGKLISFDILTGDMLFVDRLSYNFFAPKIGSGFVFKTSNIEDYKAKESDIYLVKRLVGSPRDVLEIKAPGLFRNGTPIDGSPAFTMNARQENKYPGYTNTADGLLPRGISVTVPAHVFFALGDNSPRSYDSRYWGFVPEKDVVGRPLFIYYPLTSRWGELLSR